MSDIIQFQQRLLAWYDHAGRKTLPWQQTRTPYKIWVSEIMLQQTQVATVIPYFENFIARFPNVKALATADLDHVLQIWTGLGYYARARHLHQAAKQILENHDGIFPVEFEALLALPGIGESTAGAIMAQAYHQSFAILDGNVKRVLCRYHQITGWPGQSKVMKSLWVLAKTYTPIERVADYTQAIMDLGAMVCARGAPNCADCPLTETCQAYQQGCQASLPTPKPKKVLPVRQTQMLLLYNHEGNVLLYKRPPVGLWGGLWSLLECPIDADVVDWCEQNTPYQVKVIETWVPVRHSFSHFHLDITPVVVAATNKDLVNYVMETDATLWYNIAQPEKIGLSTPIQRLLNQYRSQLPRPKERSL